jgi:uncharacterized protein YjiS (DUF1127 family)
MRPRPVIIAHFKPKGSARESAMLIASLFNTFMRYLRYQSQLMNIDAIDDRILHDIGRERSELRAEAWQAVTGAWR